MWPQLVLVLDPTIGPETRSQLQWFGMNQFSSLSLTRPWLVPIGEGNHFQGNCDDCGESSVVRVEGSSAIDGGRGLLYARVVDMFEMSWSHFSVCPYQFSVCVVVAACVF